MYQKSEAIGFFYYYKQNDARFWEKQENVMKMHGHDGGYVSGFIDRET